MAAIRYRILTRGASTADGSTHAAASVTPTDTRRLYVGYFTRVTAGTPATPTLSGTNGLGGTWTQIATVTRGQVRLTVFRSTAVSGVAGVVTCNPAETTIGWAWHVLEAISVGAEAPVQVKTANANATTLDLTGDVLAAFADAWNGLLCWAATGGSFSAVRSSDTQGLVAMIGAESGNGTDGSIGAFMAPAEVASPLIAFSGGAADCLMIACEMDHDGSDVSPAGGDGGARSHFNAGIN